jgi:Rhomboid family
MLDLSSYPSATNDVPRRLTPRAELDRRLRERTLTPIATRSFVAIYVSLFLAMALASVSPVSASVSDLIGGGPATAGGFTTPNVDNAAHLGGLGAGCLFGWLAGARIQWSRPDWRRIAASLGLGVVCCIGALLIVGNVYDVSAAVARALNLEQRLLSEYRRALEKNAGWLALSEAIESSVVPELARERSELAAVTRIRASAPAPGESSRLSGTQGNSLATQGGRLQKESSRPARRIQAEGCPGRSRAAQPDAVQESVAARFT